MAPATRPLTTEATASKPIVVDRTAAGSPPSPRDDRRQDGVVAGQAGDAHPAPFEVARPADRGVGEHGRERALDDGHDADEVSPALPRDREVVDVEHRQLCAAAEQQAHRVGGRGRRLHAQVDARLAVQPPARGGVDAGVDGVGRAKSSSSVASIGGSAGAVALPGVVVTAAPCEQGDEQHDEEPGGADGHEERARICGAHP